MRSVVSGREVTVAVSAVALSIEWAVFAPDLYPWPSLAWAMLACVAGVCVAWSSIRPDRARGDAVGGFEARSAKP